MTPGTSHQDRYPTRRPYNGTERTKEKGRAASLQEQKAMTRWEEAGPLHPEGRVPLTKKGSNRHVICTSKSEEGPITWNRRLKP